MKKLLIIILLGLERYTLTAQSPIELGMQNNPDK